MKVLKNDPKLEFGAVSALAQGVSSWIGWFTGKLAMPRSNLILPSDPPVQRSGHTPRRLK